MNEDLLLSAMDTKALFGMSRRTRTATWAGAVAACIAVMVTVGSLFA